MLHENSHVNQVNDRLWRRILIPLFVLALAGCRCANSSSGRSVEADSARVGADFLYRGEPIHPGCVWLMLTCIWDPLPCVAAVDVAGCQKSNRFSVRRTQNGWVKWTDESDRLHDGWVEWKDESEFGTGSFAYKHLGVLRNGIHVLLTAWTGGGSGVFYNLLFVRAKESRVFEEEGVRNQVLLVCVGQYGIGDRFEGKVRLEGDKVIICEPQLPDKEEILDLAEF